MTEIKTTVRCFRRKERGEERHGVWLMTRQSGSRGIFFHGDRKETQAPFYGVEDLEDNELCEEITPEQALAELESWPEAQAEAMKIFERHTK